MDIYIYIRFVKNYGIDTDIAHSTQHIRTNIDYYFNI